MGIDYRIVSYLLPLLLFLVFPIWLEYLDSAAESKLCREDGSDRNTKGETSSTDNSPKEQPKPKGDREPCRTPSEPQSAKTDNECFAPFDERDDVFERRSFHRGNRPHGTFRSSCTQNRRRHKMSAEPITIFVVLVRDGIGFGGRAGRRKGKDNR